MTGKTYIETFDHGPGGWLGWISNAEGAARLESRDGVVISRGPWWIDYNHAPPGGGYLHLPFWLPTGEAVASSEAYLELSSPNRFAEGQFPTDFTNARMTLRLKGEIALRGAKLLVLVQAKVGDHAINHVLMAQPFEVTPDWSEQTITLVSDPQQWKCMGSRHDRMDHYGWGEIADVLRDVNGDIILVLHPLDVVPAAPIDGDPHLLKAGEDYAVDLTRLPSGHITLDEVWIEFAVD